MAPEEGAIQCGLRANFAEMVAHQIRERASTRRPAFRRSASLSALAGGITGVVLGEPGLRLVAGVANAHFVAAERVFDDVEQAFVAVGAWVVRYIRAASEDGG
jgi:hypothetical protein